MKARNFVVVIALALVTVLSGCGIYGQQIAASAIRGAIDGAYVGTLYYNGYGYGYGYGVRYYPQTPFNAPVYQVPAQWQTLNTINSNRVALHY